MSNPPPHSLRLASARPQGLESERSNDFALEAAVEHGLRIQAELQARLHREEVERRAAEVQRLERAVADIESRLAEHQQLLAAEREGAAATMHAAAQEKSHLSAEVSLCHSRIDSLHRELIAANSGAAAALARRLRTLRARLAPNGTTRDRAARLFIKGLRSLVGQGPLTTARKSLAWTRRKLAPASIAPQPSATSPVAICEPPAPPHQPAPAPTPSAPAATFRQPSAVDPDYAAWIAENEPSAAQLEQQKAASLTLGYRPLISVLTPVYNTPASILSATIRSLQEQTYDRWELILADGGSSRPETHETLLHFGTTDPRVRVVFLEQNGGISNNSNACLEAARGDFVALLDHDDIIPPFALFEVAQALNADRHIDFIYSDKDMCSEDGATRFGPLFKPAWSPDQMLSANYLTHFCVTRTNLAREIGGFRACTDGAQDWDYFLRVVERTSNITHIPRVHYHWRLWSSSVSSGIGAKPYALAAQVRSIEEHFARTGTKAKIELAADTTLHLRRLPSSRRSVSIVLSTRGVTGAIPAWIDRLETLRKSSPFQDEFELVVAHYGPITQPVEDYYTSIAGVPRLTIVSQPALGRLAATPVCGEKPRTEPFRADSPPDRIH